jgi:hypothetical protein
MACTVYEFETSDRQVDAGFYWPPQDTAIIFGKRRRADYCGLGKKSLAAAIGRSVKELGILDKSVPVKFDQIPFAGDFGGYDAGRIWIAGAGFPSKSAHEAALTIVNTEQLGATRIACIVR